MSHYCYVAPFTDPKPLPTPEVKPLKQKRKKSRPPASKSYVNVGFSSEDSTPTFRTEQLVIATGRAAATASQRPVEEDVEEGVEEGVEEVEVEDGVEEVEVEDEVDAERSHDVAVRERVYYNDDVYMTSQGTSLKLDSVQQYLLDKLSGDDMDAEFKVRFLF